MQAVAHDVAAERVTSERLSEAALAGSSVDPQPLVTLTGRKRTWLESNRSGFQQLAEVYSGISNIGSNVSCLP